MIPPRPYHHGNLKQALLDAALAFLAQGNFEFSLRDLAKRAGVSHAAPYKHFASKLELMAAVSTHGFDLLAERMRLALADHAGAHGRLSALGLAYVTFGVENPALYRMMFGPHMAGNQDQDVSPRVSACYGYLLDILGEASLAGLVAAGEVDSLAILAWSEVHGLTMLLQDGRIALPPEAVAGLMDLTSVKILGKTQG